jgi:hypothetical protein
MASQEKINTNYSLSFGSREDSTNDTLMDVSISFDNPKDDSVIIHRLNTWLKAIGRTNIEVVPVPSPKG